MFSLVLAWLSVQNWFFPFCYRCFSWDLGLQDILTTQGSNRGRVPFDQHESDLSLALKHVNITFCGTGYQITHFGYGKGHIGEVSYQRFCLLDANLVLHFAGFTVFERDRSEGVFTGSGYPHHWAESNVPFKSFTS